MHDLDVYFEAMSALWALVPAYFVLAFFADEREPRKTHIDASDGDSRPPAESLARERPACP